PTSAQPASISGTRNQPGSHAQSHPSIPSLCPTTSPERLPSGSRFARAHAFRGGDPARLVPELLTGDRSIDVFPLYEGNWRTAPLTSASTVDANDSVKKT